MNLVKPVIHSVTIAVLSLPVLVFAQTPPGAHRDLTNPLTTPTITDLFLAVINILRIVLLPIILLFIIYAGFMYVTGRGNPENIQRATKALTYAIIGGVIILGAEAIGLIVRNTANSFNVGP